MAHRLASCETTSPPMSLRATACTHSRQPAACRPKPRCAAWSRSCWLGYSTRVPSPPQPHPEHLAKKNRQHGEDEGEREGRIHPKQCTVKERVQHDHGE